MKSFLKEVVENIYKEHQGFDDAVFILPSKRGGTFLKQYIASLIQKPIFSPKIWSIEELVAEISGLRTTTNLDLLLGLYEVFHPHLEDEGKNFESFISWGNTLLSDFNEIDRNLVDSQNLFDYLTANQRLKNWGADSKATPLISNTIKFWGKLSTVYTSFRSYLREKGIGYQGLLYREAVRKAHEFIGTESSHKFHFIGFNALNTAEEFIFQAFLDYGNSTVWWDIDSYFLNDNIHEAGFFIRNYLKKWPQTRSISSSKYTFTKDKKIEIIGVPKSISQAKFSGNLLKNLIREKHSQNIALVLSDETLLTPILNSLPTTTEKVNITMGLPLRKTILFSLFDSLFNLHIKKSKHGWFYKDVNKVLSNPHAISLLNSSEENIAKRLDSHIKEKNILFVSNAVLKAEPFSTSSLLPLIFSKNTVSSKHFVKICTTLITRLRRQQLGSKSKELQQLYGFFQLFNQLDSILDTNPYLSSLKTLRFLFNELVSEEKIDFQGDPLGGLQIMGVLESRNLDFETVIITSVNEGILPAGKSHNSFIPYDVKKEFGLPTYKEKDAIYAYHFYRLLQRAKNVHILYNTEPDVLMGNEKSRFISQLLTDSNIIENVTHYTASPEIGIAVTQPKEIMKTPELVNLLQEVSIQGFSPTSLTNYIKNPYDFYKSNVLRLQEVNDVEESIAYNTFGTIIHDSLEELYSPLLGQILNPKVLKPIKGNVESVTKANFQKYFLPKAMESGQNLIAYHVVQKYLSSFIDFDIFRSKSNEITLIALEKNLKSKISLPTCTHPVFLKGKLDRLERVNGNLQILDYKTGNTAQTEVELTELKEAFSNEKRAKAFQLLCYALMEYKETNSNGFLAGVVPIKKISSGILLFAQKRSVKGSKNHIIDFELLSQFEKLLADLILEILNPKVLFKENKSAVF